MTGNPLQSASPLKSRGLQRGASTVRVICGVHTLDAQVAGRTIGDVRGALSQALNISPEAIAVVDGGEVGADHVLEAGEQVEFVRLAGEKGRFPVPGSSFRGFLPPRRPPGPGTWNRERGTAIGTRDHGAQRRGHPGSVQGVGSTDRATARPLPDGSRPRG